MFKKMVETTRIRVAVLESHYASLLDIGIPFFVCLQLQELGLQLNDAQWTARNSIGGFSISFFLPALAKNQPVKKKTQMRSKRKHKPGKSQPLATVLSQPLFVQMLKQVLP